MEEKIKTIFNEKMTYLDEFSQKNNANINTLKDDLHLLTMKLKCIVSNLEIDDLKNELSELKRKRKTIIKEICDLKNEIHTLNNFSHTDSQLNFQMTIGELFSPSNCNDYQIFRSYFKEICQSAKRIQQEIEETNISRVI